tara:strand:- start:682 stop:918 length:237 start_codon:yes stop_codon:yes gene_type:complete
MNKKYIFFGSLLLLGILVFLKYNKKQPKVNKKYHKIPPPLPPRKNKTEGFQPSQTFQGQRKGKVFKLGGKGLGYYLDK